MTDHLAVLEEIAEELRVFGDDLYQGGAVLHGFADRITAAIALMRGQSWQPIETAPKDVEVWAFDPETDPKQYAAMLVEREDDEGGYYWRPAESLVADVLDYELTPTHWMPLPSPPQQEPAE